MPPEKPPLTQRATVQNSYASVAARFTARGFNLHIVRGHSRPHSHITSFRTPTASCEGADVAPGTLGAYAVSFYDIKNAEPFPFDHGYDRIYHYVLFAHNSTCDSEEHCAACPLPVTNGQSGQAELPGNDAMVSLGMFDSQTACLDDRKYLIGGTFMHELGHNFGLHHAGGADPLPCAKDADCAALGPDHTGETCHVWQTGAACTGDASCDPDARCLGGVCSRRGCVSTCVASGDCSRLGVQHLGEVCQDGLCRGHGAEDVPGYKPNYLSIMNYRYQFVGIFTAASPEGACPEIPAPRRFDYSTQVLPTGGTTPYQLDEARLSEPAGLGSGNGDYFTFVDGACIPQRVPADGAVDWDGDGDVSSSAATADLNPAENPARACGDVKDEIQLGHADWGWAKGRSRFNYRFQCMPQLVDGPNSANSGQAPREMSVTEAQNHGTLLQERSVRVSLQPGRGAHVMFAASSPQEIPVVVHGSPDLDVEGIDTASLRLGRASASSVAIRDDDGDGIGDLVATFVVSRIGPKPGARAAMFTARHKDSRVLVGRDAGALVPSAARAP